jgi:heme/copper-type cytochrome/quinol oxidase subunit 2
MGRLRGLLGGGPASALLVGLMLAGCLLLWIGIPLGWLWIGSQVESSTSLGTGLAVTMAGILLSIVITVIALGWLNRRHAAIQERRQRPVGASSALEVILVSSAGIAVVLFAVWFFGFAGASPVPLNIGF